MERLEEAGKLAWLEKEFSAASYLNIDLNDRHIWK
jgi:hypothetical protein